MKEKMKILIAVVLCMVMGALTPMQAFAATQANTYISDVKISYGKTAEEAKAWLEGQGYKVVDADLNEGANSALVSARAVYLGYKTTRKASEAITDLKVMNMTGNYSFAAYEMLLADKATEIGAFVGQLVASLEEYRQNYQKGLYKALAAHDLLNLIYDDDTDSTMGDLLLNPTVQELGNEAYNALSDAEKNTHGDMVKILMQGNSSATLAVEQYLCMASDTAEDSFLDRLAATESYDAFETAYAKKNNINSGDVLGKAMAAEYDDTALALAGGLEAFREYLAAYTESEMFEETDEDAVIAYFNENGKDGDYLLWCNARSLTLSLQEVAFEDDTLYALLTSEDYDLADEDRYMLYPLVASLSAGQKACAEYVSLAQLFNNAILDNAGWQQSFDDIKANVIAKSKTVSAYAGINRELFGNGVALTADAKQLNESSTKSYMDYWLTDSISDTTYFFLVGFGVTAIASIGCKIAVSRMQQQMVKIFDTSLQKYETVSTAATQVLEDAADDVLDDASSVIDDVLEESFTETETFGPSYCATNTLRNTRDILNHVGNVCCIFMLVFAVLTVGSAWRDVYNYYHTDKTPIPAYMVDETTNEKGENNYIYYTAVPCNRVEKGYVDSKNKAMANFGDLNGDIGKEWLALYYTKDTSAGKPVKADFLCKKGSNTAEGKAALTMFGEKNALNLTDERFAFNDACNGIYLYYALGESVFTSSAISSGILAIITVGAVLLGFVPAFFIRKKRTGAKEA